MDPTSTSTLSLGPKGSLKGVLFSNGVSRYTHIPYAQPPTGSNRWRKPVPLPTDHVYSTTSTTNNGSEPLDCTRYGAVCPQPTYLINGKSMINTDYTFDEDCLAVNMWFPPGAAPEGGWPILAWIHGGWLQIGDPSLTERNQPTQLLKEGGLQAVVVAIGYRLNIFGFLAGEGVDGNFGFWDQRCALEWIQDHAKLFGGNPERVTLGGLSAGAFSAHVQLDYELRQPSESRKLFNNVWLQSNAIPAQPKSLEEANSQLQNVFSTFGVDNSLSSSSKLDALRKIPASTLTSHIFDLDIHTFRAVTDNLIISPHLVSSIHSGSFSALFKQRGMRILLGEAESEEVLYGLTNPPASISPADMLGALNNYYAMPVCKRILDLYMEKGSENDSRLAESLELDGDKEREKIKAQKTFGVITSDVQVRAPIRVLSKALYDGGVPASRVMRYRVAFRPECTDKVYPKSYGVTHSADGVSWWFVVRYGFSEWEGERVREWLARTLVPLVTGNGEEDGDGKGLNMQEYLNFDEQGEIRVEKDKYWEWLMQVAGTLI